jgi:hypothetical protein
MTTSGRRQISKTSCLISGPTSTTIAGIRHGKGERRIRLWPDQSPISARFDGNLIVDPYIRHPSLHDFPKTRASLRHPVHLGKTSKKSFGVLASQRPSRI